MYYYSRPALRIFSSYYDFIPLFFFISLDVLTTYESASRYGDRHDFSFSAFAFDTMIIFPRQENIS